MSTFGDSMNVAVDVLMATQGVAVIFYDSSEDNEQHILDVIFRQNPGNEFYEDEGRTVQMEFGTVYVKDETFDFGTFEYGDFFAIDSKEWAIAQDGIHAPDNGHIRIDVVRSSVVRKIRKGSRQVRGGRR